MTWWHKLMGAGDVISSAGDALDKVFTSDEERAQAEAVLLKLRQAPGLMQAELNKIELASKSIFKSGWRPAIGWVCALSLAAFFIPQFLFASVVWVVAIHSGGWSDIPVYPVRAEGLMELVVAMLGMAAFRTYEKGKGLTR